MKNDIEQRAEEYAIECNKHETCDYTYSQEDLIKFSKADFAAGMTEERERGKRFAEWLACNEWEYSIIRQRYYIIDVEGLCTYEELFNKFLSVEKAINN